MLTLLEAQTSGYAGANPYVFGGLALFGLIAGLVYVLYMGLGRPNSK